MKPDPWLNAPPWLDNYSDVIQQELQEDIRNEFRKKALKSVNKHPKSALDSPRHTCAIERLDDILLSLQKINLGKTPDEVLVDSLDCIRKVQSLHLIEKTHKDIRWGYAAKACQNALEALPPKAGILYRPVIRAALKTALFSCYSNSESALCWCNYKVLAEALNRQYLWNDFDKRKAYLGYWQEDIERVLKHLKKFKGDR